MAYKSYNEQILEHINFLHNAGLDVDILQVGTSGVVACRKIDQRGCCTRGERAYKTNINRLNNGKVGLVTWCRGNNGEDTFKTYGDGPVGESLPTVSSDAIEQQAKIDLQRYLEAAKRAYGFWMRSQVLGGSDYLDSKGVGSYNIRFRNNKYGRVAVIPMRDIDGFLWSYQLLNPKTDAASKNKLFATGARSYDLFHFLKIITDGVTFGVAESYVTAATCLELTGIPMVCLFSSNYIISGSLILRKSYPVSKIILFADNDRHSKIGNTGVLKAQEAKEALGQNVLIAIPDFGDIEPSKSASDWNDLVQLKGVDEAKRQLKVLGVL